MTKNLHFKDQVAIVTGGATGIGFGIAERLAIEGAKVYLVSRKESNLVEAVDKIKNKGGNADYKVSDILEKGHIEKIIDDVFSEEKRLDIFINNAGDFSELGLKASFDEIEKFGKLIFNAPYRIAKYLAENYSNIKILTTLSHAAYAPMPGNMGYAPFKAALKHGLLQIEVELLEEIKKENKDRNVKMYRLYPGAVAVGNYMELYKNDKSGKFGAPTTVESVADIVVELLSDKAPTRDGYVAYVPGEGIVNAFFKVNSNPSHQEPFVLSMHSRKVVDPDYKVDK